eukprot:12926830-Prorocentrum_lima.AAC.1
MAQRQKQHARDLDESLALADCLLFYPSTFPWMNKYNQQHSSLGIGYLVRVQQRENHDGWGYDLRRLVLHDILSPPNE